MSFVKELASRQENNSFKRQFSRILEREIASWEYFFVENAEIFFITGAEWVAMSKGSDRTDMIAWLHYSRDSKTEIYGIEIFINADMFTPPAVPEKFKARIFRFVLEHELQEFLRLRESESGLDTVHDEDRGSGAAHEYALECEWRLAFKDNLAEAYLRCIQNWASRIEEAQGIEVSTAFLAENKGMYEALLLKARTTNG